MVKILIGVSYIRTNILRGSDKVEHIIEYLKLDHPFAESDGKGMIKDSNTCMTDEELIERAVSFASVLSRQGYVNQPIGVLAEHSIETIILFLSVLYSGNYYIPIDPEVPAPRLKKMIQMSHMKLLCGTKEQTPYEEIAAEQSVPYQAAVWDGEKPSIEERARLLSIRKSLPESAPMYLIFTSGSTGEPKGIVKTHKGMISFLNAYIDEFGFTKEDRFANQTPFYFDASAKDIYLVLKLRCQMNILDSGMFMMPLKLVEYLNEERITIIQWVPSALSILSKLKVFKKAIPQYLRMVLFVGEVFSVHQLKIWMEYLKDTTFINLYGSSEICGICSYYKVPRNLEEMDRIPIGYAMKNCKIVLVQDGKVVTESGQTGEIYVKSDALAAGYLGKAEQERSVFVQTPAEGLPEGIYYRSGDLARLDEKGALIFISRKDFQIKHMGHRIELGEIEHAACTFDEVENAGCIFDNDKIILFYEGNQEKSSLVTYLKQKISPYMIPKKVVRLDKIPLNHNGKVDRMYLKNLLYS